MATNFNRVELILARLQVERECECCHIVMAPIAGSEDEYGEFQKFLCLNEKCNLFMTCTTE